MSGASRLMFASLICLAGCASVDRASEDRFATRQAQTVRAPLPPLPTSRGGARFRLVRERDERGLFAPGALSNALHERETLLERPKVGGVTAGSWSALGPATVLGGRIRALYVDRSNTRRIFVGAATGGLWRSEDGGTTWSLIDDYMPAMAISDIVADGADPSVLYASTSYFAYAMQGNGVLKSVDGGRSWSPLASTDPATADAGWSYVQRLAAHPTRANELIAATWNAAWKSVDAGATWRLVFDQPAPDGAPRTVMDVKYNPVNPNEVLLGLQDGAVAYSGDAGSTFVTVQVAPPANNRQSWVHLAYAPATPGLVYASIDRNGGEVWRSTNGGLNWVLAGTPNQDPAGGVHSAIWVDPVDSRRVVVGGVDIWLSVDGAATFRRISDWSKWPASLHADQQVIYADPGYGQNANARVYFANDGGLYKAEDFKAVTVTTGWTNLDNGLGIAQFWGGAGSTTDGGPLVGGLQDSGTSVLRTQWQRWFGGDGGMTWIDQSNPAIMYGEYVNAAVIRTLNGGATIGEFFCEGITEASLTGECGSGTSGKANFIAPTMLDPNQPGRFLVGADSLWVTADARIPKPVWRAIKPPSAATTVTGDGNWISALAVQPGASNVIWVGHNNGELYVSNDALSATPTWKPVAGLPSRYVTRILFDKSVPSRVYVALGGFARSNLYATDDGGGSWTSVGDALPAVPIYSVAINPRNRQWLYAGTEIGLFASEDMGHTWSTSNDGPANVPVEELSWRGDSTLVAWTFGRGAFQKVTQSADNNYEGLWWNAPAGSESGWGLNLAHQGDVIFATWFTYDVSGKAWWLSMTAARSAPNVFSGTLYQTHGPPFNAVPFSPSAVVANPVGNGTLTFSDANNASFAYTVNGTSQTKSITREVFGTLPTCTFGAQPDLSTATNYQDLWWAAPAGTESGWGVNFTQQGDIIFATWFTYDLDGSPLWLSATTHKSAAGVYTGTLSRTTGPAFSAVPFDPARVGVTSVGTLTLTFTNGASGTFAYTVNNVSQTKSITREIFRAPGTVCR